jgi:hypothetical protein
MVQPLGGVKIDMEKRSNNLTIKHYDEIGNTVTVYENAKLVGVSPCKCGCEIVQFTFVVDNGDLVTSDPYESIIKILWEGKEMALSEYFNM